MKESNKPFNYFAAIVLFSIATLSTPAVLAQTTEKPYTYVEQMPQFKGGDADMVKFLVTHINYPKEARAAGVEGLVVVSFIVGTDGSISDVQTLKKLGKGTDEEAVRVVKLMNRRWKSGSQNGKLVPVRYTLPVRFALSEADRAAVADVANRAPLFVGGQEAMAQTLNSYLQLPEEAKQEDLNARITVKFTVDTDGTVSNMKLEKMKLKKVVGPGAEFDYMDATSFYVQNKTTLAKLAEAAITAVRATSGRWEPAMQNGKPVAAELVLPLQFIGSEAGNQQMEAPAVKKLKPQKDTYNYEEVDVKPLVQGVPIEKFIGKNFRYPASTFFEGDVELPLLVQNDAKMGFMVSVAIKDDTPLYEELKRVLKLTEGKWTPGKIDGQPVSTGRILTIRFVIDDGIKKTIIKDTQATDVVVTEQGTQVAASKNNPILSFLEKNLRFPSTQTNGMAIVNYEIKDDGMLYYKMSPGFDDAMADEVIRVLKLAKEQNLLPKQQKGASTAMHSVRISFTKNGNYGKESNKSAAAPDVVVTKYR